METRIIHPLLHDDGGPLDFVLSEAEPGLFSVTFEGNTLCEKVELGQAISTMLDDVIQVATAVHKAVKQQRDGLLEAAGNVISLRDIGVCKEARDIAFEQLAAAIAAAEPEGATP